MAGTIVGVPEQLRLQGYRMHGAAGELHTLAASIKGAGDGIAMPPNVAAHVSVELNAVASLLNQLADGHQKEGHALAHRASLFARAGAGGLAALGLLDRFDPFADGIERLFAHPRYYRFRTWVRGTSYFTKWGTQIDRAAHWRNLPRKWMKPGEIAFSRFTSDEAWLGRISRFAKVTKFAGTALGILGLGYTGYHQWEEDAGKHYPTWEEGTRVTVAVGTQAAFSEGGAIVGATIGTALIPIPGVGTAVGGAVGAIVGSYIGSDIANGILHAHFW